MQLNIGNISIAVAILFACGCGQTSIAHKGPEYVCYPVDAAPSEDAAPAIDAGPTCQELAPPGCVLRDLSLGDPGGRTMWCCADMRSQALLCCDQP